MTSKSEKDRAKQIQDRCQAILMQMLKDEDNKYCVDCDAKGPRWASWNLGIFLCIRCAGIHRNLGVHISKVKSVNLDSWTPEQVVSLQQMGNSRARAVYEANLPDAFRRPQTDTSLEAFIRSKYEQKRYIAKEWVPPQLPKINWDKEINEEMERQKKKKKSSIAVLPTPGVTDNVKPKNDVIPQPLPKPKSSSPKPSNRHQQPGSNTTDLLGLNMNTKEPTAKPESNQDIFNNFFSAPVEIPKTETQAQKDVLKSEEESFFNQTAVPEEKSKMTKDSILALYNQAPTNNMNSLSGMQSMPYNANFQQQQGYTGPPNQFASGFTRFQSTQNQVQGSQTNGLDDMFGMQNQFNSISLGQQNNGRQPHSNNVAASNLWQ